jgi:hypothetical protein
MKLSDKHKICFLINEFIFIYIKIYDVLVLNYSKNYQYVGNTATVP